MNCFLFKPKIAQTWTILLAFFLLIGASLTDRSWGQEKTEILPYLQNPGPTQMTVCFLSTNAADVKVEYGKKPTSTSKIKAIRLAIPETNWTIWKARIPKLQPGTTYHYKVLYKEGTEDKTSEAYTFTTPNDKALETKGIAFNDIHNKVESIDALMKHVKPEDFEYTLLVGDMWNDPSTSENAKQVFDTMASYVRQLDASNKPMIYLRGNHDTRGGFAPYMSYLFDLPLNNPKNDFPKQNAYQEFRFGPIWYVSPDAGEDGDKRAEIFQPYRQRQVAWMKEALAKSPSRNAAWRVLPIHIPLYTPNGWDQPDALKRWEPIFKDGKIDIMLSGHDHSPHFVSDKTPFKCQKTNEMVTPPFPVLVGGGPDGTIMMIKADTKKLNVRLLDATGKELHKVDLKK